MISTASKEKKFYFAVSLFIMLLCNRIIFTLGHLLGQSRLHFDLSIPADALFPFLPWTILIYDGFNFWCLIIYWEVAQRERWEADRFFCSQLLAKAISFLFFVLLPTDIIRPQLKGSSIWIDLLRHLYRVDTPDNLFPSIHCVLGWHCWIAVRGKKNLPLWFRGASLLMAFAVCLSTLTVRQHVMLDVFAGVLLSEICYRISEIQPVCRLYTGLVDRLTGNIISIQEGCCNEREYD